MRVVRPAALILLLLLLSTAALIVVLVVTWRRPPPTVPGWPAFVTTMAGDGSPGFSDGYPGVGRFSDPFGVALGAGQDGTLFVADAGDNNLIRAIAPDGLVSTVAGSVEGFADGPATAAAFHTPSGVAAGEDGVLYVADTGNHAIRRVTPDGLVTTIAGTGAPGDADGDGRSAAFRGPIGIALAPDGHLVVADTYNDRIRRIDPDGRVTSVAGGGRPGYRDGPADEALFDTPAGVAAARDGTLYVADTGNNAVRRISPDGEVTTVAPMAEEGDPIFLSRPVGIAVTHDSFLYVGEYRRGRLVQIAPDGAARVIAGSIAGFTDGHGELARFSGLAGIALDAAGGLYAADTANYLVRRIVPRPPDAAHPPDQAALPRLPLDILLPPAEAIPGLPAARPAGPRGPVDATFPWPLDPQWGWHEIVGTLGEIRGRFDSTIGPRLHTGIDVYGQEGTIVRAVRSEKARSPMGTWGFGSANEGFTIDLLTYIHLRVGRDRRNAPLPGAPFVLLHDEAGELNRIRLKRGTRFRLGDPLGTVNRLYHVQIDVGPPGAELNPLFLPITHLTDAVPPRVARNGVRFADPAGRPFTERRSGRILLHGPVRILVEAYDQVDRNLSRRRLGLYRLGYQVLRPDGAPAPGFERPLMTIEFNRLPGEPDAGALVYAEGSGITAFGSRVTRYVYIVTNHVRDGRAAPGVWDTSALEPGDYVVRIFAADAAGNETIREVEVTLTGE